MFITKMSLPRRTFLRGVGAALGLPLLDAMVPALSAAGRYGGQSRQAGGVHLHAERRRDERVGHRLLDAQGDREELRALDHPDAARAVSRPAARHRRPRSPERRSGQRRRQRRSHARHQLVADGRLSQAHRRRGRAQRRLGRSGGGGEAREGHGPAVARAVDRPQLPGRAVREQLQLHVSEHAGVEPTRRRRSRPRTTRASSSSACLAKAARPSGAPRRPARTRAFSIRCSRT